MKYAITGMNGFIGKHLAQAVRDRGDTPIAVDRNILSDPGSVTEFLINNTPDYFIHLSAYGNHYDQTDHIQTFFVNLTQTFTLLESINKYKYKGFINVSTSSVYGGKQKPMREDMVLETDTFYGTTKASSEMIARAYARQFDKPIVNVRPFSVYGEDEAEHRFIPSVVRSILSSDKDDVLKLDPTPKHDWIFIDDFIEALFLVIDNIDKLKGESINIGTGEQYSNREIVEKIEWILDKESEKIIVENQRKFDTLNWVADTAKIERLGFKPKYDIMRGLKKAVNHRNHDY